MLLLLLDFLLNFLLQLWPQLIVVKLLHDVTTPKMSNYISKGLCTNTCILVVRSGNWYLRSTPFLIQEEKSVSLPQVGQHHWSKTPTGDPFRPQEVKLAKHNNHAISSRANIRDGTEKMDLATGISAHTAHAEEEQDNNAKID
jgi:hypothetical protein